MYVAEQEHFYPGFIQFNHTSNEETNSSGKQLHRQDFEGNMEIETTEKERPRGKWKSIKRAGTSVKKYLHKKMTGNGKSGKNDVIEVRIRQEDDTDYDKQWTKRTHRAQTFDSEGRSCSSGSSSAKSRDGATSRSQEEDDGILVVHDADDDLEL